MKRTLLWLSVIVPVLLFAAYLALTAGTVFFLPEEFDQIEPGMTDEEMFTLLRAGPDWSGKSGIELPELDLPGKWTVSDVSWQYSDPRFRYLKIGGKIALRGWVFIIEFDGERVSGVRRGHWDIPTPWVEDIRDRTEKQDWLRRS